MSFFLKEKKQTAFPFGYEKGSSKKSKFVKGAFVFGILGAIAAAVTDKKRQQ